MSAPQPLTDLLPAEAAFLRLVRRHGRPGPSGVTYSPQQPVADDGQSDCWTHAWQVAHEIGGRYVEGTCRRRGANGPSMHAWVEQDSPFGPRLIECTPGYDGATMYVGITIDNAPTSQAATLTRDWTVRSSVLQAAIQGGVPADDAYRALARRDAR